MTISKRILSKTRNMASESPILNNLYKDLLYHYDIDVNCYLDNNKIVDGRRFYVAGLGVNPGGSNNPALFRGPDFQDDSDLNAAFINALRILQRASQIRERRRVVVRVGSQFDEESSKVLTM